MNHLHDQVSGLVDGELDRVRRVRALHHLGRCEACRDEVRATLEVKRRLGGLAAAEPPGDLLSALGALPSPTLAAEPVGRRSGASRRVLAGAASLSVVLLGVAYVVGAPDEPAGQSVTPPVEQFAADFAGTSATAPLADPALGALDADRSSSALLAVGLVSMPVATGLAWTGASADQTSAVGTLQRAGEAARSLSYTGERRIMTFDGVGPSVVTVRVDHVPGQGTSFDVEGPGNEATTFLATHDAAQAESITGGPLDLLIDRYDIAVGGRDVVADRAATVITASQQGTVAARFWVDDETGLLLRRDLYQNGALVRSNQFVSLQLSGRTFLSHLPPEPGTPESTALSMSFAPALDDKGWSCPDELIGGYQLVDLEQLDREVVHATYTNGLSTVAIYEQRGHLDPRGLPGFQRSETGGQPAYRLDGLPTIAVWESDGTVYSLVSDAPDAETDHVLAGLPHDAVAEPGTTDRVRSGLRRIGSFVNPVD